MGKMLKICITVILIVCSSQLAYSQEKPNIILIFTDDQGSMDLNCYGAKDLMTPNLDQMASEGVKFTQFYVGAPVCSPSRATLMTGRNPHAAGLPSNTSSMYGNPGMPASQTTIAEVVKQAGYTTAHIGKWHLGYDEATMPLNQGFDYSFGHMGGCIDNYSHFFYWNGPNRHDLWENGQEIFRDGEYFPDQMLDKAKAFINENKDQPFFMYYALNLPHYPLQPKNKWRDYYKDLPMPRREYAAFVSTVDENVGALVEELRSLEMLDNTVLIFLSDHGHSHETRTFGSGGYSGPYRGSKFSLFEGGIRVPAIIRYPKAIGAGGSIDQVCSSMDLFPTIANLAGATVLPTSLEGQDLMPVIDQERQTIHQELYWKLNRQWSVRSGPWKLIGNPRDPSNKYPLDPERDKLFLSNLEMDISEKDNLAQAYPQKVKELIQLYLKWPYSSQEDIPETLPPISNKAFGKTISLSNPPHPKYSAQGAKSLIDQQQAGQDFMDQRWLGFERVNLEAKIDLQQVEKINAIEMRCLQDIKNYIFLPNQISFEISEDDVIYFSFRSDHSEQSQDKASFLIKNYSFPIEVPGRYIKIKIENVRDVPDWYKAGAGAPAWLFVDEIIIR